MTRFALALLSFISLLALLLAGAVSASAHSARLVVSTLQQTELRAPAAIFTVNTTIDPTLPLINPCFLGNTCPLRTAIALANSTPNSSITFDLPPNSTITLKKGELAITQPMTIIGPGKRELTITTKDPHRIFNITPPEATTVRLEGMTLSDGAANGTSGDASRGGNIFSYYNDQTSDDIYPILELIGVTVTGGHATYGGNIYSEEVTLILEDAAVSFGSASRSGGGIYASRGMSLTGTSVVYNSASSDQATVAGGGFYIDDGDLLINSSTISHNQALSTWTFGDAYGGGAYISNEEDLLIVTGSELTDNLISAMDDAVGGAVFFEGVNFAFSDTVVSDNRAVSSVSGNALGGGISFTNDDALLAEMTFERNSADLGGALYYENLDLAADQSASITGSTFVSNTSTLQGGAISAEYCDSASQESVDIAITDSTFSSNISGSFGGAIAAQACNLTLNDATFTDNRVTAVGLNGCGGAFASYAGMQHVGRSTFSRNSALNGAAICNQLVITARSGDRLPMTDSSYIFISETTLDDNQYVASSRFLGEDVSSGGAIFNGGNGFSQNSEAIVSLQKSLLTDNYAWSGGGISTFGSNARTHVFNSTLSSNRATRGGGIWVSSNGGVILAHATLLLNSANSGGGIGSNLLRGETPPGEVLAANSIVALNSASGGGSADCNGVLVTTQGNNLDSDGSCTNFTATTSSPSIALLANNGGPTQSHRPVPGVNGASDIIDQADQSICLSGSIGPFDQRGYSRQAGLACDLGAVEYNGVPLAVGLHSIANAQPSVSSRIIIFALGLITVCLYFRPKSIQAECDKS